MAAVRQEQPLSFIKCGQQGIGSVEGGLAEVGSIKTERMLADSAGKWTIWAVVCCRQNVVTAYNIVRFVLGVSAVVKTP